MHASVHCRSLGHKRGHIVFHVCAHANPRGNGSGKRSPGTSARLPRRPSSAARRGVCEPTDGVAGPVQSHSPCAGGAAAARCSAFPRCVHGARVEWGLRERRGREGWESQQCARWTGRLLVWTAPKRRRGGAEAAERQRSGGGAAAERRRGGAAARRRSGGAARTLEKSGLL